MLIVTKDLRWISITATLVPGILSRNAPRSHKGSYKAIDMAYPAIHIDVYAKWTTGLGLHPIESST